MDSKRLLREAQRNAEMAAEFPDAPDPELPGEQHEADGEEDWRDEAQRDYVRGLGLDRRTR